MATPIIAGAGLLEARKFFHRGSHRRAGMGLRGFCGLRSGEQSSGCCEDVRTHSYRSFAIYRIALAVLVVVVALMRA